MKPGSITAAQKQALIDNLQLESAFSNESPRERIMLKLIEVTA